MEATGQWAGCGTVKGAIQHHTTLDHPFEAVEEEKEAAEPGWEMRRAMGRQWGQAVVQ